jgi:hypothetical protein
MSISISGISPSPSAGLYPDVSAPTAKPLAPAQQSPEDTVVLSQGAQISQLSAQGISPSNISHALGIPVATVDLSLGIIPTATATSTAVSVDIRV